MLGAAQVRVLDASRKSQLLNMLVPNAEVVQCDIRNKAAMEEALRDIGIFLVKAGLPEGKGKTAR